MSTENTDVTMNVEEETSQIPENEQPNEPERKENPIVPDSANVYPIIPSRCRKCGEPLDPGKAFCASCGTPVMEMPAQKPKSKTAIIAIPAAIIVVLVIALVVVLTRKTPVTAINFDETSTTMAIGTSTTMNYSIAPEDAAGANLTWTSSDESVATVDKNGMITAVEAGNCTITATAKSNASAAISVTVGAQVESVAMRDKAVEIKAGENTALVCTVSPSNVYDDTLTWESSNETIATVDNGVLFGLAEGVCTITATAENGISDTCTVTVNRAGPDFMSIYEEYCSAGWATLGSDGSYLKIDTNPDDTDDDDFTTSDYAIMKEAIAAIEQVNEALGLSESVYERMKTTTALQGVQTADGDDVTVTWTYHPDNGLEVMYEAK
jgi:predicted nucleic acid-binding Zn ribbon protein